MEISAYASLSQNTGVSDFRSFIVETFFSINQQSANDHYILITDKKPLNPCNTKVIINPQPQNVLLKKLWWDVKLPAVLKKLKADLFISFENVCSLTASIPQIIIVDDAEKIKSSYLRKANLLIVNSQSSKKQLIDKYKIAEEKISVIYPSAGKNYKVINDEKKEVTLKKYSEGKEYFFYNGHLIESEKFIELLKSFSHFKKRQQSSFKLLLVGSNSFEKNLINYKYRNDVKFVDIANENELAVVTAAAYTVVLPFNSNNDLIPALNGMQAGVPIIATRNSVINEIAGEAALYTETGEIKDVGEKMMQLYTDETYRSTLIKKGMEIANKFSQENATKLLLQAINSVLK